MGFDPQEDRSPSFAKVIREAIDRVLRSTYTMMPGIVTAWNPESQTVDVQPLIRFAFPGAVVGEDTTEEDLLTDLPVLPGVPIVYPRSKYSRIYFRLDPGSKVMIVFSTFSLEKWLAGNGAATVDPQDVRHHDLSDAVVVPGLYPGAGDPIPDFDDADVRIINEPPNGLRTEVGLGGDTGDVWLIPSDGDAVVQLGAKEAAEAVLLGETGIAELETLAQSFIDNASTLVQTGVGPGVLSPTVATALQTFITNLANWLAEKAKVT